MVKFAPTNTDKIVPKSTNEYQDAYTKDIPHLTKLAYKKHDIMFNYQHELPNRPMGTVIETTPPTEVIPPAMPEVN